MTRSAGCVNIKLSRRQAILHVLGQWRVHGPHQVPKEWADKYKGKFDDGWDKYRERVFQRAKQMGWIPSDAQLTPRPGTLASWDSSPTTRSRSSAA